MQRLLDTLDLFSGVPPIFECATHNQWREWSMLGIEHGAATRIIAVAFPPFSAFVARHDKGGITFGTFICGDVG